MYCSTCTLIPLVTLLFVAYQIYRKLTTNWCKSQTCLIGKTTIVTGANTGIGYETSLDFAKRGARVILACRDEKRANTARRRIIEATGNENVIVKIIDMGSFASIRAFAKNINETEKQLDILVNNAGVAGMKSSLQSEDGHVLKMQINYFGPFLLTLLLIDLLKKTKSSRIVNVASIGAKYIRHFDVKEIDVPDSRRFIEIPKSKLCIILFTIQLARRLKEFDVSVFSLHPGVVKTGIFRNTKGIIGGLINVMGYLFFQSPEEGAQTTIYCSVTKGLEKCSGHHFADCREVSHYETVTIPGLAEELWNVTINIVDSNLNI